jgi:hypothetical protein
MMKTNAKRKNSAAKKLIPAAGMLALSASMLATSTYAWFTMNRDVQVTGMEVRTKISSNLLICTTNLDADYSANTLLQSRKALLEPVSSINGGTGTFYYTTDAKASGEKNQATSVTPYVQYGEAASPAVSNAVAGKANYDSAFNDAYGLGADGVFTSSNIALTEDDTTTPDVNEAADGAAYGYVDYIFYLKATTDSASQALQMTQCDLDYNGSSAVESGFAWRAAVFAYDVTTAKPGNGVYTATDIAAAANQKGLIAMSGADNWTDDEAVTSTTATAAVVNNAAANGVVLDTIADANVTKYYKVVVRLWLEGEDESCNTKTYASLTNDYSLDLKFELGQGTAVKNISTNTFDAAQASGKTQTGDQYDAAFGG